MALATDADAAARRKVAALSAALLEAQANLARLDGAPGPLMPAGDQWVPPAPPRELPPLYGAGA